MNSPNQLRKNIQSLTSHLEQVREMRVQRLNIEIAHIGKECKRTAGHITELLKVLQLPEKNNLVRL